MSLPVRAALWFTVAGVALKGMATITTPIFTRLMTTDQFGLYSLTRSWMQILAVVTTLSLASGVFSKGMSKYPKGRDAYTATMQTVTTALVLLFFVAYAVFHNWIDAFTGLSTLIVIAVFAELLFTNPVTFWMARERYDFRYKRVVLVTLLIAGGVSILSVVAVLLADDKGTARVVAGALVPVAVGAFIYIGNLKRAGTAYVRKYATFALLFNLGLIPHYLSMYVLDQLDRIMIAQLIGLSAVGVYSVGYTVGIAIRVTTDSILSALIPWQYRLLESGNLRSVERRLMQIFGLYALLILVFVGFAPELVAVLGGDDYSGALYVIPPVAVSTFFIFAYIIFGNIEIYYDAKKMMMYASPVAAVVNVTLNYAFIPRFGYVAAAYTTLACYAGLAVAHYIYMTRVVASRENAGRLFGTGRLLLVTIALLGGSALLVATYPAGVLRFGIMLGVIAVVIAKRQQLVSMFKSPQG